MIRDFPEAIPDIFFLLGRKIKFNYFFPVLYLQLHYPFLHFCLALPVIPNTFLHSRRPLLSVPTERELLKDTFHVTKKM